MIKEYGLIGYPLSHSFSQKYFTEKFEKEGIDAVFHAFSIPSIDNLHEVLNAHPLLQGFAITIPYKRAVIKFLDNASNAVQKMNACNCVKIREGKLYGYNTDVIGFEKSFVRHLKFVLSRFTLQISAPICATIDTPSGDQAAVGALKVKSFLRFEPSAFIT